MFLAAGTKEPKPVWSRRVGFLDGITFAPDGHLFFGYRGDLWVGSIAPQEENDETPWLLQRNDAHRSRHLKRPEPRPHKSVFSVSPSQGKCSMCTSTECSVPARAMSFDCQGPTTHPQRKWRTKSANECAYTQKKPVPLKRLLTMEHCPTCAQRRMDGASFSQAVCSAKTTEETRAYLIENNGKPREIKLKLSE